MKTSIERGSMACKFAGPFFVAALLLTAYNPLHAGIIHSGDLLTVSNTNVLRSYNFAGDLQQTLQITGLAPTLAGTGVAQGVAVIDDRLFIGLVSTVANFTPKIVEVNPTSGVVLNVRDTATPQITALGDNGTDLLILDSVNVWNVYTYSTAGSLLSTVAMERHAPLNFQMEGIDGDGTLIFMSTHLPNQPILINTAAGDNLSHFDTDMAPLESFIGGLAYDSSDSTLWVAGTGEFRQFSQSGMLLRVSSTGSGNAGVTGLEIISGGASAASVPEPSSFVVACGLLVFAGCGMRRRRRARLELHASTYTSQI